ncbi:hypothetical protein [Thermus neutrinimicus]|uniref:hypothetical protein n=1 Tax=Thermus neutrinimicus TaxID=2908149 RepID=UPI001FA9D6EA|nr:hypothetical protein [Thermus neutrinimicus]
MKRLKLEDLRRSHFDDLRVDRLEGSLRWEASGRHRYYQTLRAATGRTEREALENLLGLPTDKSDFSPAGR